MSVWFARVSSSSSTSCRLAPRAHHRVNLHRDLLSNRSLVIGSFGSTTISSFFFFSASSSVYRHPYLSSRASHTSDFRLQAATEGNAPRSRLSFDVYFGTSCVITLSVCASSSSSREVGRGTECRATQTPKSRELGHSSTRGPVEAASPP